MHLRKKREDIKDAKEILAVIIALIFVTSMGTAAAQVSPQTSSPRNIIVAWLRRSNHPWGRTCTVPLDLPCKKSTMQAVYMFRNGTLT